MYTALGVEAPEILQVPIIPQAPASADQPSQSLITPTVDGLIDPDEWADGGIYLASGDAMTGGEPAFQALHYGFDFKRSIPGSRDGIRIPQQCCQGGVIFLNPGRWGRQ